MKTKYIAPIWPAPKNLSAFATTRKGGYSLPPFDSFNLANHVGDNEALVLKNRALLRETLELPSEPVWLNQQHTNIVVDAANPETLNADGAYTNQKNIVCVAMTADCLPVLLCDEKGHEIAALHAGWRGLFNGIIESGVRRFQSERKNMMAWLGPAISSPYFEVGEEVRDAFIHQNAELKESFIENDPKKFLMDVYKIARNQLQQLGVTKIYSDHYCTFKQRDLFYSYRRDNVTGRIATLIWRRS
jgi:hypothetical protein